MTETDVNNILHRIVREEVERVIQPYRHALKVVGSIGDVVAKLGSALQDLPREKFSLDTPDVVSVGEPKPKVGYQKPLPLPFDQCAIIGCQRRHRSRGFCATHYQKFRLLKDTGRLPPSWLNAKPQSLKNVVLPRGHAGQRALKEARGVQNPKKSAKKYRARKVPHFPPVRHPMARQ